MYNLPNVLAIGYGSVLTKRPDDGSVETKHVALNVLLTINWICLTEKKSAFSYLYMAAIDVCRVG